MGIGEVIRPLKNSLDGVPVHVRQLADMFRKHSQRQDLNRSQVTALDNVSGAWRTDTHWTPDAVVSWKGDAPDPGDPSELTNLRMPSGNEAGANEHWIPGGYLPTGIPEAVIDIPSSATGVGRNLDGDYNPGLWPRTAQRLDLNS